jgi:hypothetical protein
MLTFVVATCGGCRNDDSAQFIFQAWCIGAVCVSIVGWSFNRFLVAVDFNFVEYDFGSVNCNSSNSACCCYFCIRCSDVWQTHARTIQARPWCEDDDARVEDFFNPQQSLLALQAAGVLP